MRFRDSAVAALFCIVAFAGSAEAAVEISSKPTKNMNCADGICSSTAKNAVLNTTDLAALLAVGAVSVRSDHRSKDIDIKDALSWTNSTRLTLDAFNSILIEKPVVVAGGGNLTITTGAGGDYQFANQGHVELWDIGSDLVINGQTYVLVNDIASLSDAITAHPDGHFAFARNYDAKHDGKYQAPVATPLQGVMEGLGNSISNLKIKQKGSFRSEAGFFSEIEETAVVRDINLVDEIITTSRTSDGAAGLLAAETRGTIKNAIVSGTINARYTHSGLVGGLTGTNIGTIVRARADVKFKVFAGPGIPNSGGLVGFNGGTVDRCSAAGSGWWGGLVGENFGLDGDVGLIIHSHASGDILYSGGGGLVFDNRAGTIKLSFATGNVLQGGGGLVGGSAFGATIDSSYATGQVIASSTFAGGLVGIGASTIRNSYSTGSVSVLHSSAMGVGGLIGEAVTDGTEIESSYSIGAVSGTNFVGGAVGEDMANGDTLKNIYWDFDTSGISNPAQGAGNIANDPGIGGLPDVQLRSSLPEGFDPSVWAQSPSINNGYPYLIALPPQ